MNDVYIRKLLGKYETLMRMNKISWNGCSDDDYLYRHFLLGQKNILYSVIEDLNCLIKQSDKQ